MSFKAAQQQEAEALAVEILQASRSQLQMSFRFLDLALNRLAYAPGEAFLLGTDGEKLYFSPREIFRLYRAEQGELNRAYLHSILHCVFYHPFVHTDVDQPLWDLACDMAVEAVLSELESPALRCARSSHLREELAMMQESCPRLTAERIYRQLRKHPPEEEERQRLSRLFRVDSHTLWYPADGEAGEGEGEAAAAAGQQAAPSGENAEECDCDESGEEQQTLLLCQKEGESAQGSADEGGHSFFRESSLRERARVQEQWQEISQRMKVDLETSSLSWGEGSESLRRGVAEVNRERYDYGDFLRKFSVLGEEMQINDEEFDYIFYTYGLQLYENVPLIEPTEYKEVRRIRDFVIAIDTSASVEGELVQQFVNKTYNILHQQENFFTKINLHILQCDTRIQEAVKITSPQDFERYLRNMELRGFGGTDFRPVFRYVEELLEAGEFQNLKGLIYFTDGYGDFPEHQPEYHSAFVFVDDEYNNPDVPVWAIKLVLQRNEI